jgi:KEOPS complex subunit Cgi121
MLVTEDYNVIVSHVVLKTSVSNKIITQTIENLNSQENDFLETYLFLLDAEAVAGLKHLQACIFFSIKAFQQKLNTANSLKAEILLYLAGNRQINKAIQKVGVSEKTKEMLFLCLTKNAKNKNLEEAFFARFLQNQGIVFSSFAYNILEYHPKQFQKILKNLEITDKSIELIVDQSSNQYTYEKVVEKLAIEKSALLNLNK